MLVRANFYFEIDQADFLTSIFNLNTFGKNRPLYNTNVICDPMLGIKNTDQYVV